MIEDITSFNFNTTPRIIYGTDVAKDASPFSKLLGDKILLITDKGLTNLGLYGDFLKDLKKSSAGAILVSKDFADYCNTNYILVSNVHAAYAKLTQLFFEDHMEVCRLVCFLFFQFLKTRQSPHIFLSLVFLLF